MDLYLGYLMFKIYKQGVDIGVGSLKLTNRESLLELDQEISGKDPSKGGRDIQSINFKSLNLAYSA